MLTASAYLVGLGLGYIAGRLVERKFWLTEIESLVDWAESKIEGGKGK